MKNLRHPDLQGSGLNQREPRGHGRPDREEAVLATNRVLRFSSKFQLLSLLLMLSLAAASHASERIVSTAGAVTETLFALGAEKEIVAVDVSSVFPEAANALPRIGYARQLSAEGILSMNPTVVFATEDAGPPEVIKQLTSAGVKVVPLSNRHTPEAAAERIIAIGDAINHRPAAKSLVENLKTDLELAQAQVQKSDARPKVLFIYARAGGVMNVSGTGTSADAMITLAGGVNAVQGFENYKPLTAEGAVAAAPDFILVTSRGLESSGGIDGLLKHPGLALTPAGKEKKVIVMDDLFLLGFGPRLGQAARELCEQLHPGSKTVGKREVGSPPPVVP
ncbi:MAG: hemin ABC transporter substrate-binding protein [Terrimicrobiaceae bacterium]